MSLPDSLPSAPPANWEMATFYRPPSDDCAVLENGQDGTGRVVSFPTDGPRTVLFSGSYGAAYEAWLALAAVS